MAKVLVFRTNYDLASSYLHYWGGRIVDYAASRGHHVIDLEGANAVWDNLYAALEQAPDIVIFSVHGLPDMIAGDLSSPLLVSCQNDDIMAGKTVAYGTCLAGQILARTTSEKGAPVVLGYLYEYVWHFDPNAPSPKDDRIAAPFGDFYCEPIFAMLDGLGPEQVFSRATSKYNEISSKFRTDPSISTAMASTALHNDMDGLVIYAGEETYQAPASMWPVYLLLAGAVGAVGLAIHRRRKR